MSAACPPGASAACPPGGACASMARQHGQTTQTAERRTMASVCATSTPRRLGQRDDVATCPLRQMRSWGDARTYPFRQTCMACSAPAATATSCRAGLLTRQPLGSAAFL
eukprot:1746332-Pleurochrysis_carterae.AAC.3